MPRKVAAAARKRAAEYPATVVAVATFWTLIGAWQIAQNVFGG